MRTIQGRLFPRPNFDPTLDPAVEKIVLNAFGGGLHCAPTTELGTEIRNRILQYTDDPEEEKLGMEFFSDLMKKAGYGPVGNN